MSFAETDGAIIEQQDTATEAAAESASPKKTSPRKGTHAWRMSRDDYQPTAEDLAEQARIKAEIQRERAFAPDPHPVPYTRRVYKVAMLPSGRGILKGA